MPVERLFQMTRLRKGSYLLPGNAGGLFLIYSYVEDGSLQRGDGHGGWTKVTGTFWGWRRFQGGYAAAQPYFESLAKRQDPYGDIETEIIFSERWEGGEDGFETRQEAIDAALEREAAPV